MKIQLVIASDRRERGNLSASRSSRREKIVASLLAMTFLNFMLALKNQRRQNRAFVFLILLLFSFTALSCSSKKTEPYLSPLSSTPDWSQLQAFQNTLTREEFLHLIQDVYTQGDIYKKYIALEADRALIQKYKSNSQEQFVLHFAKGPASRSESGKTQSPRPAPNNPEKPLSGFKIAIDPGHIGGAYAKDEERWFKLGNYPPVAEGEITLTVSQILQKKLELLGAQVFLVRNKLEPLSPLRPETLRELAKASLRNRNSNETKEYSEGEINDESKTLAYRVAEIRERARLINDFKPDLTLVVHFNAENWGDPDQPTMSKEDHLHLIVHGSYTPKELEYDDIRFEMLKKLLSGSHDSEMEISKLVVESLKNATGLPPCIYPPGFNAKAMNNNGYLWARNLLANRLYQGPVIYLEPYVMNNSEVYQRLVNGDYEGKRWVAGQWQKSIFREYADGVIDGLLAYQKVTKLN